MGKVLFQIALFAGGLLLIAFFVKWYTAFCYRLIVTRKDDVLEGVLSTREVPRAWRRKSMERIALARCNPLGRIMERLLVRAYARRVKKLIPFVSANRRANAEQKRADIDTIKDIRREWRACRTLEELVG